MRTEQKKFEMADADNFRDVIRATQASIFSALKDFFAVLKEEQKGPGVTWEQIDFILQRFSKKSPEIIVKNIGEVEQ